MKEKPLELLKCFVPHLGGLKGTLKAFDDFKNK